MNNGLIVINIIFWLCMAFFEDIILKSDFFCKNVFQTYYLKDTSNFVIPQDMKNSIKIRKEGYAEILNDKAYLFKFGINIPLLLFLMLWPILYICWTREIIVIFFMLIILIITPMYCALIMFLKYKFTNYEKLNEKCKYIHSYYTFGLHYNLVTFITAPVIIIKLYLNPDIISYVVLLLILIKIHAYLFIEKLDIPLNWNILETSNLNKVIIFEVIFLIVVNGILWSNGLY